MRKNGRTNTAQTRDKAAFYARKWRQERDARATLTALILDIWGRTEGANVPGILPPMGNPLRSLWELRDVARYGDADRRAVRRELRSMARVRGEFWAQ